MTETQTLARLAEELGPTIAKDAAERDQAGAFVAENYALLKEHKIFSAQVPTELGGRGASHSEICDFIRRLAHYCPSTGLPLAMHQHVVSAAVFNYRNGRPGEALLRRVADGEAVLVSTGANDWLESNGEARPVEGGYRISGRKPFGSGSPAGDVLVTSAPCRDEVLHFAVPFASEGVSLAGDWDTMGMRATGSQTIILDDVFVPEAAVVLKREQGVYHPAWNVILTVALPIIMSVYAGIAEVATETAIGIASKRHAEDTVYLIGELGNLLTTTQIVHADMVRIANDLDFEASTETANAILSRKTITANAALATVEKAMHVTGGAGFFRKFGLERLLRDVHAGQFHPLPEKRQQRFSGRLALGLDPITDIVRHGLAVAAE